MSLYAGHYKPSHGNSLKIWGMKCIPVHFLDLARYLI